MLDISVIQIYLCTVMRILIEVIYRNLFVTFPETNRFYYKIGKQFELLFQLDSNSWDYFSNLVAFMLFFLYLLLQKSVYVINYQLTNER